MLLQAVLCTYSTLKYRAELFNFIPRIKFLSLHNESNSDLLTPALPSIMIYSSERPGLVLE